MSAVIQGGEQPGSPETEVVHYYFGIDKIAFLSEELRRLIVRFANAFVSQFRLALRLWL